MVLGAGTEALDIDSRSVHYRLTSRLPRDIRTLTISISGVDMYSGVEGFNSMSEAMGLVPNIEEKNHRSMSVYIIVVGMNWA